MKRIIEMIEVVMNEGTLLSIHRDNHKVFFLFTDGAFYIDETNPYLTDRQRSGADNTVFPIRNKPLYVNGESFVFNSRYSFPNFARNTHFYSIKLTALTWEIMYTWEIPPGMVDEDMCWIEGIFYPINTQLVTFDSITCSLI